MDAPATNIEREAASRSAPPDWDHVPFDVACARCGHDIHGLTDPKCPACQLEFDWADAVPIEQLTCPTCDYHLCGLTKLRCPECGEKFTWPQALHLYRCRQGTLFEYRWRDRPLRSLVATWFRLWRPARFWRQLDIFDPPQFRPLLATVLAAIFAFSVFVPISAGVLRIARWPGRGGGSSLIQFFVVDLPASVRIASARPTVRAGVLIGIFWLIMSFASLMIFRQSMRRYRIRVLQVFRLWTYCVIATVPAIPVTWLLLSVLSDMGSPYSPRRYFLWCIPVTLCVGHLVWSLGCGYRDYLRMKRGFAVAVASQAVAILATATTCLVLFPGWSAGLVRYFPWPIGVR